MVGPLDLLVECTGFQWDEGNAEKNWIKHRVGRAECEEIFHNEPLLVTSEVAPVHAEPRSYVLGQTDEGRSLFVVVAVRDALIRVVSARNLSRRERKEYEHARREAADAQDTEV